MQFERLEKLAALEEERAALMQRLDDAFDAKMRAMRGELLTLIDTDFKSRRDALSSGSGSGKGSGGSGGGSSGSASAQQQGQPLRPQQQQQHQQQQQSTTATASEREGAAASK